MTIKTFFHETWQSVSGCMELIVRSVAKESAQDKLFKCDISLSNMSEKPLYSYLARKKQVNNVWVILLGVLFNARHLVVFSVVLLPQEVLLLVWVCYEGPYPNIYGHNGFYKNGVRHLHSQAANLTVKSKFKGPET